MGADTGRSTLAPVILLLAALILPALSAAAADTDADGITDAADDCPYGLGSAAPNSSGCPDADSNGVADRDEEETFYFGGRGVLSTVTGNVSTTTTAWAKDDSAFAVGYADREVILYDSRGKEIRSLGTVAASLNSIDFSPDGTELAVALGNGKIILIDTLSGAKSTRTLALGASLLDAIYSPDGKFLFAGTDTGNLLTHNISANNLGATISFGDEVRDLGLSSGGSVMVAAHGSYASLINTTSKLELDNITTFSGRLDHVAISPDGGRLAAVNQSAHLFVLNLSTSALIVNRTANLDAVRDMAWSPFGSTIAVAGIPLTEDGQGRVARLYNVGENSSGETIGSGWNQHATSLSWSSTGSSLLIGLANASAHLMVEERGWLTLRGLATLKGTTTTVLDAWDGLVGPYEYITTSETTSASFSEKDLTEQLCDGEQEVGVILGRPHQAHVTLATNYSSEGWSECRGSNESLITVPIGRVGLFFATGQGTKASQCISNLAGLSTVQLRYAMTNETVSEFISPTGYLPPISRKIGAAANAYEWSPFPGLDSDGTPEFADFSKGATTNCPDGPTSGPGIGLRTPYSHLIIEHAAREMFLCESCNITRTFHPDLSGSIYRGVSDVTTSLILDQALALSVYDDLNVSGIDFVPVYANETHGASDLKSVNSTAVTPSEEAVANGTYPLSVDINFLIPYSSFGARAKLVIHALDNTTQGLVDTDSAVIGMHDDLRIPAHNHLPDEFQSLLPDQDGDGVWDGKDQCSGTKTDTPSNSNGCALVQLDSDNDGFNDAADGCRYLAGNATEGGGTGCPDSDGDGYANQDSEGTIHDAFPDDPTQWSDQDGDQYGDNPGGNQPDACITTPEADVFAARISSVDRIGCTDTDRDGYSDPDESWFPHPDGLGDSFPEEPTQWWDCDGDGFGDNWANKALNDSRSGETCASPSYSPQPLGIWFAGAIREDHFPRLRAAANDSDSDGWADDWINGEDPGTITSVRIDICPHSPGRSTIDRIGCPDTDGDGYSDPDVNWTWESGADNFTEEPSQWWDCDGDGFGDNYDDEMLYPDRHGRSCDANRSNLGVLLALANISDICPLLWGNSTGGHMGCPDSDGDGLPDPLNCGDECNCLTGACDCAEPGEDAFPCDPERGGDIDGDGFDDATEDDCPTLAGNSSVDRRGCPDTDGDGYSDPDNVHLPSPNGPADAFVNDSTQWSDIDGDGFGDNYELFGMNVSGNRPAGHYRADANNSDHCPEIPANDASLDGCIRLDSDSDGLWDDEDECPATLPKDVALVNGTGCATIIVEPNGGNSTSNNTEGGTNNTDNTTGQTNTNSTNSTDAIDPAVLQACLDDPLLALTLYNILPLECEKIVDEADDDDDDDGWSDVDEIACSTDPKQANDVPVDQDGDGVCAALDPDDAVATRSAAWYQKPVAMIGMGTAAACMIIILLILIIGRSGAELDDDDWDDEFTPHEEKAQREKDKLELQMAEMQQKMMHMQGQATPMPGQTAIPMGAMAGQQMSPPVQQEVDPYGSPQQGYADPYAAPASWGQDQYTGSYSGDQQGAYGGGGYENYAERPSPDMVGQYDPEGWEILEYPQASGVWYYRDPVSGEWYHYG